jgi:hypothetical protein
MSLEKRLTRLEAVLRVSDAPLLLTRTIDVLRRGDPIEIQAMRHELETAPTDEVGAGQLIQISWHSSTPERSTMSLKRRLDKLRDARQQVSNERSLTVEQFNDLRRRITDASPEVKAGIHAALLRKARG